MSAATDTDFLLLGSLSADEFYGLSDAIRSAWESYRADDYEGLLADRLDVRLSKGIGRYNVTVNGTHLGWICRPLSGSVDDGWTAYASRVSAGLGVEVAIASTRREALDDFLNRIAIYGLVHYAGSPAR